MPSLSSSHSRFSRWRVGGPRPIGGVQELQWRRAPAGGLGSGTHPAAAETGLGKFYSIRYIYTFAQVLCMSTLLQDIVSTDDANRPAAGCSARTSHRRPITMSEYTTTNVARGTWHAWRTGLQSSTCSECSRRARLLGAHALETLPNRWTQGTSPGLSPAQPHVNRVDRMLAASTFFLRECSASNCAAATEAEAAAMEAAAAAAAVRALRRRAWLAPPRGAPPPHGTSASSRVPGPDAPPPAPRGSDGARSRNS